VLFHEYFSSFRKRDKNSIELEVDGQNLFQPRETAVDFTEYITLSLITIPRVICQLILCPHILNFEVLVVTHMM